MTTLTSLLRTAAIASAVMAQVAMAGAANAGSAALFQCDAYTTVTYWAGEAIINPNTTNTYMEYAVLTQVVTSTPTTNTATKCVFTPTYGPLVQTVLQTFSQMQAALNPPPVPSLATIASAVGQASHLSPQQLPGVMCMPGPIQPPNGEIVNTFTFLPPPGPCTSL